MYNAEKPTYRALALPDRVQKDSYLALKGVNKFLDYMRKRHSVRDYSSKKVSKKVTKKVTKKHPKKCPKK